MTIYWPIPDEDIRGLADYIFSRTFPPEEKSIILDDIQEWWNVSRRQKHGLKAVWSKRAFDLSVYRLLQQDHETIRRLLDAGIEHGWQALNPEYLKPVSRHLKPWTM